MEQAPALLRYRQPLSRVRFQRVEDRPGRPPSARGRGRTGPIEAWVWPDGTVARYRRFAGRSPSEDHVFDRAGIPWATVFLGREGPERAVVGEWPPVDVDLETWTSAEVGPAEIRGPGVGLAGTWTSAAGTLRAVFLPGRAEPASQAFADGVAEGCGCLVSAPTAAHADGRPGVGWRLDFPDPDHPEIGELWAFSAEDGVFVLGWTAARGAEPTQPELAPGRAALALAHWRSADDSHRSAK